MRRCRPRCLLLALLGAAALLVPGAAPSSAEKRCFCQVTGYIDDCTCDVETIDTFNNQKLFPRLNKLLESDYFRHYKVNLKKPCPFWNDSNTCGIRNCAVHPCPPNEVPGGTESASYKYSEEASKHEEECEEAKRLGAVNESLSEETKRAMQQWIQHEDSSDNFCEADGTQLPHGTVSKVIEAFCTVCIGGLGLVCPATLLRRKDDVQSPDAEYVDLLLNPERYTGYKGPEAWKIWNSIYEENCFKPPTIKRPLTAGRGNNDGHAFYRWLKGICVEKRAFYRLISGLHSSINIHLCARYLLQDTWAGTKWGHNITEFQRRFDEVLTQGEGPKRLKNLYFLYLIELRAMSKILPFFERPGFQLFTANEKRDLETKTQLLEVLRLTKSFPLHFNENSLFAGNKKEAAKLKTQGLGTALKILFSEKLIANLPESGPSYGFHLTRQEIVAFFNAFGRISTSVRELENFKNLLRNVQ